MVMGKIQVKNKTTLWFDYIHVEKYVKTQKYEEN